jgi:large subunit ribosomal protein L21
MYAVIAVGSFQFKVQEGEIIDVPTLSKEAGQKVDIDSVLMVANGDSVTLGTPYVKGAKVTGEIVRHFLDVKDINFKFRRRKNSKKTKGHRQGLTALRISKISA